MMLVHIGYVGFFFSALLLLPFYKPTAMAESNVLGEVQGELE
jgi:hypothetical protein